MGVAVARIALACFVALALSTSMAAAQPAAPPDASRAIELGNQAMERYGKADFTAAYERFAEADKAAHSPVFVLYMARCKRGSGDLLAARELLARAMGEVLPDSAPDPWRKARADAARELPELEARIPALIVTLRGAPAGGASVTVDGAPVSPEALRAPIRVNPGPHEVEAKIPGRAPIRSSVRLAEGDAPLKVDLVVPDAGPQQEPPPPPQQPAARGSLVPGLIGIGLGAGGIAAGAITGALALSKASDIKSRCTEQPNGSLTCPYTEERNVGAAQTLSTVSVVSFVAGGVAAAAGIVLVIVRPGGGSASARLVPGPGSMMIEGRF